MRKVTVVCLALLALLGGSAQASESPQAFEEPQPYFGQLVPGGHALALTLGPEGNVWFEGATGDGRMLVGS